MFVDERRIGATPGLFKVGICSHEIEVKDKFENVEIPSYIYDADIVYSAADLIVNGKVVIDGSKLIRYANMTDIHVLTQRYFENYYFNIVDDVYIDTTDQEVNFRNWQKATTNNNGHITFNQSGDQLLIASAVTTEQMELIGYTSRFMEFYIVGDTPDKLIACLKVDIHKLQAGQIERFDLDYDIDKVNILYHNPKLKVNKRKIT